ncbi:MAG: hypothetical protein P9X24_07035 [Candidatus Hatepunaea meridiana]|nr:hypothetical protein [Candidatus Hatepunaea meridiana]
MKAFKTILVVLFALILVSNVFAVPFYIPVNDNHPDADENEGDFQALFVDNVAVFEDRGEGVDYIFGVSNQEEPPAVDVNFVVNTGNYLRINDGVTIQLEAGVTLEILGKMENNEGGETQIVFQRYNDGLVPESDAWERILITGDNQENDNGIVELTKCLFTGGGAGDRVED